MVHDVIRFQLDGFANQEQAKKGCISRIDWAVIMPTKRDGVCSPVAYVTGNRLDLPIHKTLRPGLQTPSGPSVPAQAANPSGFEPKPPFPLPTKCA